MRVADFTSKRINQILILIILGASTLIVLFISARLFIKSPADSILPPTINPLVASIDLSITITGDNQAVISGSTNLPDGTILLISAVEENGNFTMQYQVPVEKGSFASVQFGSDGGLNFGTYIAEARMPPANQQPEWVQERIGPRGENLVGSLVFQEENGAIVKVEKRFEVYRPTPMVNDCIGPGIGLTAADHPNGFELTLLRATKTFKAFGEEPPENPNKDYGNVFVFVEISYKNIDTKQRFVSYLDFVLFVNEDFALGDLNIPYTYYPDARFTVNKEAKGEGFFGLKEVLPGESFTGKIAFLVPDISHNYVFSSSENSCMEQDGNLQCYSVHPNFQFND